MIYFCHVLIMFSLHYSFFHNVSVITIHLSSLSYVPRHEVHLFAVGSMLGRGSLDDFEKSGAFRGDNSTVHRRMCIGGFRVFAQQRNHLSVAYC